MIVEFSDKLKEKTVAFCMDELNYHIKESGCADEYHNEILAQIEILFLLGETELARRFAFDYGNEILGSLNTVSIQQEIHELLNKYPVKNS